MITTTIVTASIALALAFSVAWVLRPGLRARIEHPKHEFQRRLRRYDRTMMSGPDEAPRR